MKKLGVIIKHPFRDWDWRIDIYEVPEDMEKHELKKYVESKMLGPFEVIGISDKIDFDRKVDFSNAL
jgi:hypothetical protein